jgi:excisionase family DNA binding protein
VADKLLLTVKEVAQLLDCHPDIVYAKVREGLWPHTRPFGSRNIRFTREQVEQIARIGAVEPIQQQTPRRRKAS